MSLEVGDDGDEVGVARALAVAVDGALHVRRAGVDGRHRVGDGAAGVVVAVDPQARIAARSPVDTGEPEALGDVGDDVPDLAREHAAVGVAQGSHLATGLEDGTQGLERVGAVDGIPVEEVLGIDEDAAPLPTQERHGVADHREVLVAGRAQRTLDVPDVGLRDEGDDRCTAVEQCSHERVGRGGAPGAPGRTERRERRVLEVEVGGGPGEELGVLRVRPGPATFDEAHAEPRRGATRW